MVASGTDWRKSGMKWPSELDCWSLVTGMSIVNAILNIICCNLVQGLHYDKNIVSVMDHSLKFSILSSVNW